MESASVESVADIQTTSLVGILTCGIIEAEKILTFTRDIYTWH